MADIEYIIPGSGIVNDTEEGAVADDTEQWSLGNILSFLEYEAAAGSNAPTGTLYGPLFGPFAGPI